MASPKPPIKTPTTIEEFRRLANAFLTGSAFPAGTSVYVIASTAGIRPIQGIVAASDPDKVSKCLDDHEPHGFRDDEADCRVVYQVTVPEIHPLSEVDPTGHVDTGEEDGILRGHTAEPPEHATLGDIDRVELHVNWTRGRGKSVYDFRPHTDAILITRGAREALMYPFYGSIYGDAHVQRLKARKKR